MRHSSVCPSGPISVGLVKPSQATPGDWDMNVSPTLSSADVPALPPDPIPSAKVLSPDWPAPELDVAMAQGYWGERISASLCNPDITVKAFDTVPLPGDGKIACRWELRLP